MGIDQTNQGGKVLTFPSGNDPDAWRGIVSELSTRLGIVEGKLAAFEIERAALLRERADMAQEFARRIKAVNVIAGRATAASERIENAIHELRAGRLRGA